MMKGIYANTACAGLIAVLTLVPLCLFTLTLNCTVCVVTSGLSYFLRTAWQLVALVTRVSNSARRNNGCNSEGVVGRRWLAVDCGKSLIERRRASPVPASAADDPRSNRGSHID
jgi:hypothetical protein